MIFTDLADGESIFLDANIFVYCYAPDADLAPACQSLLSRVEHGNVIGYTSTHVLTEAAHRLMTLEAIAHFGYPAKGIAHRLARRPADVQLLTRFAQSIGEVFRIGVKVLTIDPQLVVAATLMSQPTGLLSNDALLVTLMREHALTNLASHDADFDRVPGITRYSPA